MDVDAIKERLREAAETEKRLPKVGPRGVKSNFPTPPPGLGDWNTEHGPIDERDPIQTEPPTSEAVKRMDEVMEWLEWLSRDQARVVWMRAKKIPWKVIQEKTGKGRTWLTTQCRLGIAVLEAKLV